MLVKVFPILFPSRHGCSGGGIETAPGEMASVRGVWRGGIALFGQKADKWLNLASVNTASWVHKSSPKLAHSRVRLLTGVLKQKAGVMQG